jgi:hypothetical protein
MRTPIITALATIAITTGAAAQERYFEHAGPLLSTYRCYHAAVASGNTSAADALLRRGDYEAIRRGLSIEERGQVKGYARRMAEEDVRTFGTAAGAFSNLGCHTAAAAPIVPEDHHLRTVPPR